MLDLFSIVVPAALSTATGWATKGLLDALVGCPKCGNEHERTISNHSLNSLRCGCETNVPQYSSATPTTVINGRLMGANIFNPHWEAAEKATMFSKRRLGDWFLLDVSTVGMQHRGMVVSGAMRDYRTNTKWPLGEMVLNNPHDRTHYQRQGWFFPIGTFPASHIVAEITVKSLEGDTLHSIAPVTPFVPIQL